MVEEQEVADEQEAEQDENEVQADVAQGLVCQTRIPASAPEPGAVMVPVELLVQVKVPGLVPVSTKVTPDEGILPVLTFALVKVRLPFTM